MKKFCSKLLIFSLPFFILSIEVFLPLHTFTYRPWEALLYSKKHGIGYPFYPNQRLSFQSVGDLAHHTNYAVFKNENWVTDEFGYRNDTFIKSPNIILIGDSFIAGSGLPQDSTLTNLLMSKLNTKVYNFAPATFNDFISFYKNKIIDKPSLIIFSIVEKNIPDSIIKGSTVNINRKSESEISIMKDKLMRLYSINYFKARIFNEQGIGIKGEKDTSMFFLEGKNQFYQYNKLEYISNIITSYKNFCNSIGVDFIFLPIPNKETVYFDRVSLNIQPDFIFKLNSILASKGVKIINTLSLFHKERRVNDLLLYHLDDTHWNSRGVNVVSNAIVQKIVNQYRLLK